ncbi:uncharacterized protein LOC130919479 isoform X2 [Corythoichthys intestinalis]|uniref:uncharacterized protein LOC130919479 isoform X2 n=1 Tax=Corythoichthys intestinalis TaxID=161448 RepID=UPI0025A55056|nr:uncharacterized protein LOC130919479 isoform X2 [Corythoichthys intestinalis]
MRPNERKTLLAMKENIEMELFSSEESCELLSAGELKEDNYFYKDLEHPLVICEEEPTLEMQDTLQKVKPNTVTPSRVNKNVDHRPPPPVFMEDIEIEMEEFPLPMTFEARLVDLTTPTFHEATSHKARRMKWKRLTPQQTGLVVKDVLCLPRGYYNEEIMRNIAPQGEEQSALSALGMTARITIDRKWSAKQMESRLVVLFQGRLAKEDGQKFSFTYLQCIQQVLFIPITPAEGWTGEQVLRISGQGSLYILSHHDHLQTSSETVVVDRESICQEKTRESCREGDNPHDSQDQPQIYQSTDAAATGCIDVTGGPYPVKNVKTVL